MWDTFEGRASAKEWIMSSEDCNAMYNADEITIWCDAKEKGASRKRKNDREAEVPPLTKWEEREKEENTIFVKLSKKHASEKLHLHLLLKLQAQTTPFRVQHWEKLSLHVGRYRPVDCLLILELTSVGHTTRIFLP